MGFYIAPSSERLRLYSIAVLIKREYCTQCCFLCSRSKRLYLKIYKLFRIVLMTSMWKMEDKSVLALSVCL